MIGMRGDVRGVLIVSHLWEPSVDAVTRHLSRQGTPWARLNCEDFPLVCEGAIYVSSLGCVSAELRLPDRTINSADYSTVWFRRVAVSPLPKGLSDRDKQFAQNEAAAFLTGFLRALDARWVNERAAQDRASSKVAQLAAASAAGFRCPMTLVTNSPADAQNLAVAVPGDVIFKPVSGYSSRGADFTREFAVHRAAELRYEIDVPAASEPEEVLFSQLLTEEKLREISSLTICPAIFQEYIQKRSEIRVTVVGQEDLFACEILSQEHAETSTDFRRMVMLKDPDQLEHRKHELPPDVSEKLFSFMRSLGLEFGCIDLILTPHGEYVFLEINPAGQWMWIESRLDWPISAAVGALLARPEPISLVSR